MPQSSLIMALHGFLGQGTDWSQIKKSFLNDQSVDFETPQLFGHGSASISDLETYARESIVIPPGSFQKKIFIGYSLGGRIGLALLSQKPELFDHYVFLSTNPGFRHEQESERLERLDADQNWSSKISRPNWMQFLKEWNAQKVFESSKQEPVRDIENYDVNKLQDALVKWSLGRQKDYSNVIQLNNNKMTWVVGDKDQKYLDGAEDLKQKKILLDYKRISSGHRIWLDQPQAIVELLHQLLNC